MDLEELARKMLASGKTGEELLSELSKYVQPDVARAIIAEAEAIGKISGPLRGIIDYEAGPGIAEAGVGCRGTGDSLVHRGIASIIGSTDAIIDPLDQDDAGVVRHEKGLAIVSVDGIHSRLGQFPFLAGFHVARAAARDTIVMGAKPLAIFSDLHIGNGGSVGQLYDFIAGASLAGELLGIPLISGSTLRIGGDLVLGDRLTGCVGAVALADELTPRKNAKPGDFILMTRGNGGGTITSAAIFNGMPDVALETLSVSVMRGGIALIEKGLADEIHAMTDVTNGGIRGDALDISAHAGVKITLDVSAVRGLINPRVLEMLDALDMNPLGVSIDSLLVIGPEPVVNECKNELAKQGLASEIVGRAEEGEGVFFKALDGSVAEASQLFREEPYTPVKKVVGVSEPENWGELKNALKAAEDSAREKKERIRRLIAEIEEPPGKATG